MREKKEKDYELPGTGRRQFSSFSIRILHGHWHSHHDSRPVQTINELFPASKISD